MHRERRAVLDAARKGGGRALEELQPAGTAGTGTRR